MMKFPEQDVFIAFAKDNGFKGSFNELLIQQLQSDLGSTANNVNDLMREYYEITGQEYFYGSPETFNYTTESGDTITDEALNPLITE